MVLRGGLAHCGCGAGIVFPSRRDNHMGRASLFPHGCDDKLHRLRWEALPCGPVGGCASVGSWTLT
eukprot:6259705-Prorocentrum_lima.AAC.1